MFDHSSNGSYLSEETIMNEGSNVVRVVINQDSNAVSTSIYALEFLAETDRAVHLKKPRTKTQIDRLGLFKLLQRSNPGDYTCGV